MPGGVSSVPIDAGVDRLSNRDDLRALMPRVYDELKRLARRERRRRTPSSLVTTALAHEAYLRLDRGADARGYSSRQHFLASAAQAMRHVLVDAARRRMARKRGDGRRDETLDEHLLGADTAHAADVLAIDQTLARLSAIDPRLGQVVECRFFAGLTEAETGEALGISARTVHRDWLRARAWLARRLGRPAAP